MFWMMHTCLDNINRGFNEDVLFVLGFLLIYKQRFLEISKLYQLNFFYWYLIWLIGLTGG